MSKYVVRNNKILGISNNILSIHQISICFPLVNQSFTDPRYYYTSKNFRVCDRQKVPESYFGFVIVDALLYVDINLGIHYIKSNVAQNEKGEKSIFGVSY